MYFRITADIVVYDTKISESFLGDFCPSCQRAYIYEATMQNLETKVWYFR